MPNLPIDTKEQPNSFQELGPRNSKMMYNGRTESLTIDPDFKPKGTSIYDKYRGAELRRSWKGGGTDVINGYSAIASATDENGLPLDRENPMRAAHYAMDQNDVRNTMGYDIANTLKQSLNGPGLFAKYMNTPVSATTGGAAIGATGGALLAALLNLVSGGASPVTATAGALLGTALGGTVGYLSNRGLRKSGSADVYLEKLSTMYKDPRNFLLEKLQRDNGLSMADKAIIAGKIRNMSISSASNLEKTVRSALGAGVGTIMARFFGLGLTGGLIAGAIGALAGNALGIGGDALAFTRRPSLVPAFNLSAVGFNSYNEYFSSINRGF